MAKRKSNWYVDNERFIGELKKYKKEIREAKRAKLLKPPIPSYIGEYFLKIAEHLSFKASFIKYSFKDEMISDAVENCFSGSTKILTIEYGPAELKNLVGKEVTIKARDGIWRKATVKSFGKQPLYEYGFGAFNVSENKVHQKVVATKNHRWFITSRRNLKGLVKYKNEEITDLKLGDSLEEVPFIDKIDKEAIIHGLIFGDGTGHKCQVFNDPPIIGKRYYIKDVPFTTDPEYISGFIYGWWLADGNKTTYSKRKQITTSNEQAALWLKDYAAYGGYQVTSFSKRERKSKDGSFCNGKSLYTIGLAFQKSYTPKVRYIKEQGIDEVFCVIEPVTRGFTLANGLLTGNCLMYFENYNPNAISKRTGLKTAGPFAYFTQIIYYAFCRRIAKEKKQQYVKYKSMEQSGILDSLDREDFSHFSEEVGKKVLQENGLYNNMNEFIQAFEDKEDMKKKKEIKRKKDAKEELDREYA